MTTPKDLLESFKRLLEPKWTEQLDENQRYKILKTPMVGSSELQDRLATSPVKEVPHEQVPDTALSVRQAAKKAREGDDFERPRSTAVRYDRSWRPKPMSDADRDAFKIALKHRGKEPAWEVDPEAEKEFKRRFHDITSRAIGSQVQRDKEVAGRLGGQEAKRAAVNDRIQSILKRDPKAFGKLQASRSVEPKRSFQPAGTQQLVHGPNGETKTQWTGAPIRDPLAGKKLSPDMPELSKPPQKLEPRELAGKWLKTKVAPEGVWGPKSADPELIPNPRKNTGGAARMVKLPGSVDPKSGLSHVQRDELGNRAFDASRDQHSELSDFIDSKRAADREAAEKEANRAEREKAAKSHRKAKKINDKREAEEAAAEAERARVDLHQGTFNVANLSKEERRALIAKKAAEAAAKMSQAQETKIKDDGGAKKMLSPELAAGAEKKIVALERALATSMKRVGKYSNITPETIQKQQDELDARKVALKKGVVFAPAAPPKQVSDEEEDDGVLDTTPIKEPQAVTDAHRAANLAASERATRKRMSHKYGLMQRDPKVVPAKPDEEDFNGDRAPVMGPVESKEEPLDPELMEAFRMFRGQ